MPVKLPDQVPSYQSLCPRDGLEYLWRFIYRDVAWLSLQKIIFFSFTMVHLAYGVLRLSIRHCLYAFSQKQPNRLTRHNRVFNREWLPAHKLIQTCWGPFPFAKGWLLSLRRSPLEFVCSFDFRKVFPCRVRGASWRHTMKLGAQTLHDRRKQSKYFLRFLSNLGW